MGIWTGDPCYDEMTLQVAVGLDGDLLAGLTLFTGGLEGAVMPSHNYEAGKYAKLKL